MTWTAVLEVKGVGGTSATSQALTLTTSPAAGDFIVLLYEAYGATSPPASATVVDSKGGNTWTQDVFATDGNHRAVGIWHTTVVNGGAGFQVTVTPITACENNLVLHRYASPGGAVSLDSASTNHSVAFAAITSGALTVSGGGPDLAVAFAGDPVTNLTSAGTGFTLQADITTGDIDYFSSEDQLGVTAGLTPNFPFTINDWICGAAVYKYNATYPAYPAAMMMGL